MEFVQLKNQQVKRADIKIKLKYGHIMLNGKVTRQFNEPVNPGDEVAVNVTRPFVVFSHPRMQLVYEDDDIIVVNKGYGLLSVGTGSVKKEDTAYNILKDYVKRVHPMNKIFVVHRLDRDTSGLMLFAKSPEAQQAMQHNWNNMVLDRTYVAVLEGVMEEDSGLIRSNLSETSQFEVYSSKVNGEGKQATTRYKVIRRGNGYTLAQFSLDTGRKNQIRVHANDLGHPIVGDRKYGAKRSPIHRLALHAATLRFAHPITRRDMNFSLPIPSRFMSLVRQNHK
jgi:23S rRNA pseudouridine1911/1915/1917 synthase